MPVSSVVFLLHLMSLGSYEKSFVVDNFLLHFIADLAPTAMDTTTHSRPLGLNQLARCTLDELNVILATFDDGSEETALAVFTRIYEAIDRCDPRLKASISVADDTLTPKFTGEHRSERFSNAQKLKPLWMYC